MKKNIIQDQRKIFLSKKFLETNLSMTKYEMAVLVALSSECLSGLKNDEYFLTATTNVDKIMSDLNIKNDNNSQRFGKIVEALNGLKIKGLIDFDGDVKDNLFRNIKIFKSYTFNKELNKQIESFMVIDYNNYKLICNQKGFVNAIAMLTCYVFVLSHIWDLDPDIFDKSLFTSSYHNRITRISKSIFSWSLEYLGQLYGATRITVSQHIRKLVDLELIYGMDTQEGLVKKVFLCRPEHKEFLDEYADYCLTNFGKQYKLFHSNQWIVGKVK